jgi:hypothetical protein
MNSLVYLLRKRLKNTVVEILHKPGKLILWIIMILLVGFMVVLSILNETPQEEIAPLFILKGIVFLYFALFVLMGVRSGLSKGDSLFDMNDVNLLFTSPVDSRHILLYGVVQMAKMALFAGFFILYQGANFQIFGLGIGGPFLTLLGFILCVVLMQTVSLIIYSVTNGSPKRKTAVKLITAALFLPVVLTLALNYFADGNVLQALENTINSPIFNWTPIAGWTTAGAMELATGGAALGITLFGVTVLAIVLAVVYILHSNPDYYEDVLVATETAFEKKRAMTEGQVAQQTASDKKVRVKKTGIGGLGASAFFYKHLRESFREHRLGLWGLQSVIFAAGAIIYAFAAKDGGLFPLLIVLMSMQIMFIGTGRGLIETYMQFIYLVPESPFKKILWSSGELLLKVAVETIVMFLAAGLIMGESAGLIALCMAVYFLFSFLLIGVNYFYLRISGADVSAGLMLMIYFLSVVLVMLPGIVGAVLVGALVPGGGMVLSLAVLAGWELVAGSICFLASKGILHNCDFIPTVKTN